jgi:hypothetical protein
MRVGWLPGRLSPTFPLNSIPGVEVIPLDAETNFPLPEIVVLDETEAINLTPWLEHPIVVIWRGPTPPPDLNQSQALVFHLPPESDLQELQRTLRHAEMALLHVRQLHQRLDEMQRRLQDRILVEKAKGVLIQRFGLSEDEAYRRMRLQSRQERRPMRAIAEALLTSIEILPGTADRPTTVAV